MSTLHIAGVPVELDRAAVYDLLTALSELHGRRCTEIGSCGDMEEANRQASGLANLTIAYNATEKAAAEIDGREPTLISANESILNA